MAWQLTTIITTKLIINGMATDDNYYHKLTINDIFITQFNHHVLLSINIQSNET